MAETIPYARHGDLRPALTLRERPRYAPDRASLPGYQATQPAHYLANPVVWATNHGSAVVHCKPNALASNRAAT
jgi:hypothetical protein